MLCLHPTRDSIIVTTCLVLSLMSTWRHRSPPQNRWAGSSNSAPHVRHLATAVTGDAGVVSRPFAPACSASPRRSVSRRPRGTPRCRNACPGPSVWFDRLRTLPSRCLLQTLEPVVHPLNAFLLLRRGIDAVEALTPDLLDRDGAPRVRRRDPLVDRRDPVLDLILVTLEGGRRAIELHALRQRPRGGFARHPEELEPLARR